MNKLIIFLLLLNIAATLTVGYTTYTNEPMVYKITEKAPVEGLDQEEHKKFEQNVYQGLQMLMSGDSQIVQNQQDLNIAILRIHHFAEPHSDKFYEACPECQKDKTEITEDSNTKTISN